MKKKTIKKNKTNRETITIEDRDLALINLMTYQLENGKMIDLENIEFILDQLERGDSVRLINNTVLTDLEVSSILKKIMEK